MDEQAILKKAVDELKKEIVESFGNEEGKVSQSWESNQISFLLHKVAELRVMTEMLQTCLGNVAAQAHKSSLITKKF